tara:strand:- start:3102 stop:3329 length:228 start_codon:yes stop_codon:yes gene_type:complete
MTLSKEEYNVLITCLREYIGKRRYLGGDDKSQADIAEKFLNKAQDEYQRNIDVRNKNEEDYKNSTLGSCKSDSCE